MPPARSTVPVIPPVPDGVPRPFWSVMIPTYNCADLLRVTLRSVLEQAPGPDEMQIEVIDDVSTKDDPEAVVREVGQGRVGFYRQPANVGAIRNFNTCLTRSRGHWVHVLHGDDCVESFFYQQVGELAKSEPLVAAVITRTFIIEESGSIAELSPRIKSLEAGDMTPALYTLQNHIRFPGVVLNRAFLESEGGFDTQFPHVADWEMWVRAIGSRGVAYINRPLASYRVFEGNDTSRLVRTAENLYDYMRLREMFRLSVPGFNIVEYDAIVRSGAENQVRMFALRGDEEAAAANRLFLQSFFPPPSQAVATSSWQRFTQFGKRVVEKVRKRFR